MGRVNLTPPPPVKASRVKAKRWYLVKIGFNLGKLDVFGKIVVFGQIWLYVKKLVILGQNV